MALGFQISAGTIPGRAHLGSGNLLLGRNNQDAFALRVFDDCIIATVQDGCSSGAHSEIGASIGGRVLLRLLHDAVRADALRAVTSLDDASVQLEKVRKKLLCKIAKIADLMMVASCEGGTGERGSNGDDFDFPIATDFQRDESNSFRCESGESAVPSKRIERSCTKSYHKYCAAEKLLHDCFLFTTFGLIVTSYSTIVFSIGDGVFAINGNVTQVGPFPNNAPPYVAYALLPTVFNYDADLLRFKIHAVVPTSDVESLLIATDGLQELIDKGSTMLPGKNRTVGHVSQLWTDDRFFDDGEHGLITPWLRQVNSEVVKLNWKAQLERSSGLLSDDTTLIAIRKRI